MLKKIILAAVIFGLVASITGIVGAYFLREEIAGNITLTSNTTNPAAQVTFYDELDQEIVGGLSFPDLIEAEMTCLGFTIKNTGRVAILGAYVEDVVNRSSLCGGTATSSDVVYDWGIPLSSATSTETSPCLIMPELAIGEESDYMLCIYYPVQDELFIGDILLDITVGFDFEVVN